MTEGPGGRGRTRLSPAERKHRAMKAAAARWGKPAPAEPGARRFADLEPRDAILEAAMEALLREDVGLVTVQGVADAAGVGLPTLYRYFPTKEALINACRIRLVDRGLRWLDALVAANASPAARICALALGLCYHAYHPPRARQTFLGLVDPRSGSLAPELGPTLNAFWRKPFEAAQALCADQAEARILHLQAAITGLARYRPLQGSIPELQSFSRSYEDLALFALTMSFPGIDWGEVRAETVFRAGNPAPGGKRP